MTFPLRPVSGLALAAFALLLPVTAALSAEPVRCTVMLDAESGEVLHRQGTCDEAVYPMSTFKVPLAVMGYDAGILVDETTPRWGYQAEWDRPERERKPVDPTVWEKDSIVWYSQEIARRLGREKFAGYVRRFGYGNADVSGGPNGLDGLTQSWLMSSLKITPDEQADFLLRLLAGDLPVSAEAVAKTRAILPRFEAKDGWTVHGKTGSGSSRDAAGKPDRTRPIGWFVGWAEKDGRKIVFARLIVDNKRHSTPLSFETRDSLIADLPELAKGF
ncbi:class D beta-lactamase [Pseudomonas sp. R2.Fl]|nr:class D beta-lactamase [Pseudomonas sp. R2.Fl]